MPVLIVELEYEGQFPEVSKAAQALVRTVDSNAFEGLYPKKPPRIEVIYKKEARTSP